MLQHAIQWQAVQGGEVVQAAQDYRVDPYLHEACRADVDTRCKGVKPEKGQVQACLVCSLCVCWHACAHSRLAERCASLGCASAFHSAQV